MADKLAWCCARSLTSASAISKSIHDVAYQAQKDQDQTGDQVLDLHYDGSEEELGQLSVK